MAGPVQNEVDPDYESAPKICVAFSLLTIGAGANPTKMIDFDSGSMSYARVSRGQISTPIHSQARSADYVKSECTRLRAVGLDERWLQERILEDPSILGLGNLTLIQRERR